MTSGSSTTGSSTTSGSFSTTIVVSTISFPSWTGCDSSFFLNLSAASVLKRSFLFSLSSRSLRSLLWRSSSLLLSLRRSSLPLSLPLSLRRSSLSLRRSSSLTCLCLGSSSSSGALSLFISMYWSYGTLFLRHFVSCFGLSSSTSCARGALATKSTSATWKSSLRINSPPLSPSTNAVATLSLDNSCTVSGMFVPSTAIAFFTPALRRLRTSDLPSTMMMASESFTAGPAGQ